MKELTVISGKGGTGKTSIAAAFAALASNKVLADCDVDAPDLHILLKPEIIDRESFTGGKSAAIIADHCTVCGQCAEVCRYDAVVYRENGGKDTAGSYWIDPIACEGCGVCAYFCPEKTIEYKEQVNGELYESKTRFGPMVHARLHVAEENSGKLVSSVRTRAREVGESNGLDLTIIDGAPGIGCPVIASVTGTSLVLIVTEPTLSGFHDLERVAELCRFFKIPATVCINKCDLNPELADKIKKWCLANQYPLVGEVPYDPEVILAQIAGKSTVEYSNGSASQAVSAMWQEIMGKLNLETYLAKNIVEEHL